MGYSMTSSIKVLIAEDDDDDFFLTQRAFEKLNLANQIHRVADGEELLSYLRKEGDYSDPASYPLPYIILLDLNMPKKDGREALKEIKADPKLKNIPVVILTTSAAEEDVIRSYDLGVNSFIRKPVDAGEFIETIGALKKYWFEIVQLPPHQE